MKRRKFIQQASAASAAFFIIPRNVLGKGFTAPSDRITLGFIGVGKQGFGLKNSFIKKSNTQILAVSDVWGTKSKAFSDQVNAYYTEKNDASYKSCTIIEDYKELLQRKDIDAVVIATPDHWHAVQAVHAAEAKKDIYCEKPLSLTIAEGRAMVNATRKHKRVFQTGSMQRSWKEFRQAVALVQGGHIGDLSSIKVSVGGPPVAYNLPEETLPPDLNWDRWLGPNVVQSHYNNQLNPALGASYWGKWRDYKEFGGGQMTDWGAHMFDIAQWALKMDDKGPVSVTPPDGAEFKFLTYKYENGLVMTHENFGTNNAIQFNGSKAKIELQRGKLKLDGITMPTEIQNDVPPSDHYDNFLNAIKDRSTPVCDVEIGHRTASVCTIGNIAYELKRPLKWDYKKEHFVDDKEADKHLTRLFRTKYSYRTP